MQNKVYKYVQNVIENLNNKDYKSIYKYVKDKIK